MILKLKVMVFSQVVVQNNEVVREIDHKKYIHKTEDIQAYIKVPYCFSNYV